MYTQKNRSQSSQEPYKRTTAASSKQLSDREKAQRAAKRRAAIKRRQQKQRRALLLSFLFFLIAVGVLVWAIILLVNKNSRGSIQLPSATKDPAQSSAPIGEDVALPKNTQVEGIDIGEKTAAEAKALLETELQKKLSTLAVTVESQAITHTLKAEDIGAHYDIDAALALAAQGGKHQAVIRFDPDRLQQSMDALNDQIPGHAVNASFSIEKKSYKVGNDISGEKEYTEPYFVFTEGSAGMQLDGESMKQQLAAALEQGQLVCTLQPEVITSTPAVGVAELKKKLSKLSSFTTDYYFTRSGGSTTKEEQTRRENRDSNISKAIGMMNVIKLEPGDSFSFNKTTGERSEKKGWALAPAVYQGSHRAEPGGGVCQVSTTMFNALLRAGIDVTSHKEHSLHSDYVPKGMDATVNYGSIDFKFKNNKAGDIYLFIYVTKSKASSHKKTIHVDIYGPEEPGVEYEVKLNCLEEEPAKPTTKPNKKEYPDYSKVISEGYDGSTWEVKVIKKENGRETVIYEYVAKYDMIEAVTEVGTKPTPAPTKTPAPTRTPDPDPPIDDPPYYED